MAKKVTIILPAGIAVWPKLDQVDVYQPTDKKGRPSGAEKRRFITRVKYNDEDHREVDDFLKQCLKDFDLEDGKLPWKKDKKTGGLTLEATSDDRPPVFDAKNRKVPAKVIIGGGSTIKLDVTVNPYTASAAASTSTSTPCSCWTLSSVTPIGSKKPKVSPTAAMTRTRRVRVRLHAAPPYAQLHRHQSQRRTSCSPRAGYKR